jgi:hypothetical protein
VQFFSFSKYSAWIAILLVIASVDIHALDETTCPQAIVSVNTWSTGAYHVVRSHQKGVPVIGVLTQAVPDWAQSSYQDAQSGMSRYEEIIGDGHSETTARAIAMELVSIHPSVGLVIAGSESPGVELAQHLSRQLGLPSVEDPRAIAAMTNKIELANYLRSRGQPYIPFVAVHSEAELIDASKTAVYPCVLKPDNAAGSTGVSVVNNATEMLAAYRTSVNSSRDGATDKTGALIQPFLYDPNTPYEYAVNMFNGKITGVWEYHKRLLPAHNGASVPMYDVQVLLPPDDARVKNILIPHARTFLDQFKGYVGPLHLEIYLLKNQPPVVGDAGFRFAGGLMPQGELFATNSSHVELPALWVRNRTGYQWHPNEYTLHRPVAGIMATHLSDGGRFTQSRVADLSAALERAGGRILEADFYYAEGEALKRTVDADTSVGMINVTATRAEDLAKVVQLTKRWIDSEQYRRD